MVTAAVVLGLAAGSSLTFLLDGPFFAGITALLATGVLSTAVVTGVALFVIRQWLAGYDSRTRTALADVARQQHEMEQQQAEQEAAMEERASLVSRESATAKQQLADMSDRLDKLTESRAADQEELKRLREENGEILAEYNTLVRETLQAGAAQFARRPVTGPRLLAASDLVPEPRTKPTDTSPAH